MPPKDPSTDPNQMPPEPEQQPGGPGGPGGKPPEGGSITMEMPVETFAVMAKLAEQLHGAFQAAGQQIQQQAGAKDGKPPGAPEEKPSTNPQAEGADDADLEKFAKDLNSKHA